MNGIVLVCDKDGIIVEVVTDTLGISRDIKSGDEFIKIFINEEKDSAKNFIKELIETEIVYNHNLKAIKDGEVCKYSFSAGKSGEKYLIVGSGNQDDSSILYEEFMKISNEQVNELRRLNKDLINIKNQVPKPDVMYDEISKLNNELVNAQRELAKKNAELEKLNQLKNQFLGIAAHDLRNPISVIHSYAEFVLEDIDSSDAEKRTQFLEVILKSSQYMIRLIEEILDVTSIEAGLVELNYEKVDLVKLLKELVNLNSILSKKKQIIILFDTEINKLAITIDENKITQVVNNLLTNAMKFSFSGNHIDVGLKIKDSDAIISIRDYGVGIPEESYDKIFKAFSNLKTIGTAGEKSFGLGLSIVKKILISHKGKIWFESKVGQGTTFYFSLPLN